MLLYEIVCKCSARTPSAPVVCGFTFTCEWWRWWGGGWGGGKVCVAVTADIVSTHQSHRLYSLCPQRPRAQPQSLRRLT